MLGSHESNKSSGLRQIFHLGSVMEENRSLNRKIWLTAAFFSGTLILLILIIFHQCKQLAINEAEKNLANFLLNHKAIRYFVEEIQKPEIYRLKDTEKLYREYFSPKLLSSTYIARNIQNALNVERQKKGLDPIYFKLASRNPRNRINLADEEELELLQAFNAGTLQDYKAVISTKKEKVLYYAIPIAPNKQSCMRCHGDDLAVAPKEMVDHYGDQAGFQEKIDEIRALISVRVSMAGLIADANKTAFILSSATFLLLSGAFIIVFNFFRKIDAQKELALENFYYLNSILQSSTDTAIIATDLNFNIKYFNNVAEQLFGVPAATALKSNIEEIDEHIDQKPNKRFLNAISRVRKQGSYDFTLEHNKKTLTAHVSAIEDDLAECIGFLLLGHDVSDRLAEEKEREEIKERLQKTEKMESLGLMAGGVAHDLNNILSGIVSYPELLLLQLPEDSDLREPIKAIQESGKRAATVVADLLTVARGAASIREPHSLNTLIDEYSSSPEFNHLKSSFLNITYQQQFEATQPVILCSPVHVKKCLMNLVTNAFEAIADEGAVVVSTYNRTIDDSESNEHNIKNGEYVVLSVQDTGPGISDKDLEHIFEPFYTKKVMGKSGSGLGLAVVWNTVQDHGGRIFVESSDRETRFQLYFPICNEAKVVLAVNGEREKLTGSGEYILVIDDEPQLRDIASQMLQSLGYKVDSVCSGELAIQFVKEKPVDLIVIDMLMEPGLSGRQTYEEIIKIHPDQKAIIASGFSESDDVKATLRLGASGFIKKPYSMGQLGQVVQEALR